MKAKNFSNPILILPIYQSCQNLQTGSHLILIHLVSAVGPLETRIGFGYLPASYHPLASSCYFHPSCSFAAFDSAAAVVAAASSSFDSY
mmetsp:Transcript_18408/g.31143  ORF Transcript_18408/g.31143 Transcript_18408/m.31143 type:complete len:89 (-) Transcript_18408:1367-1633(-)